MSAEELPKELFLEATGKETWPATKMPGLAVRELWVREGGISISLLRFDKGAGLNRRHRHASNQFMYCLSGQYSYPDSDIVLSPGDFYWNPKGNFHGPAKALEDAVLLEIYDGPHYVDESEAPDL
jgi:2,4'-dihydroxyacetophenone dioxygenase